MVVVKAKRVVSKYREAIQFPSASSAALKLDGAILTLESTWSQRNIEQNELLKFVRNHTIDTSNGNVIFGGGPQNVRNELWNKTSPSGKYRAVLRSGANKKEDRQFLEIYDGIKLLKTIDVLASEKHGKIISDDGQFGSFEWSSSENQLLFMAEKKRPKTGSFFDPKAFEKKDGESKDEVKWGEEFENVETWGEQLEEITHPVICIMDIESGIVSLMENVPDDLSPGQAIWTPDDAGIVFCAWRHEPFRLGLKFCIQRKGALYHLDIQKASIDRLSSEGRCVRIPRFSPDLSRLIFLDCPEGGPHYQCNRLVMIDWSTKKSKVVLDTVRFPQGSNFPGIYSPAVSWNVWFDDNVHLAIASAWRSENAVIVVNTDTGAITRLTKADENVSLSLLCVKNNILVMNASSLSKPSYLLVALLKNPADLTSCVWLYPDGDPETLDWLTWKVLKHMPTKDRLSANNENLDYESIICLPKQEAGEKLPPLIVFPHGGPHSVTSTGYNFQVSFFCLCGYAVQLVNFRGSTGFGQDNIESLLGCVGTQDVKDVESAMMDVVASDKVDPNRLIITGGSHGGLLTTHLIGQYPDTFKAAASRNPVVNIASKFSGADNFDKVFVEAGLNFQFTSLVDENVLPKLWNASPMSHVNKVKTPTLLLTGLADLRVPPAQSMEYYKALKARNVPVKWLCYPGNNHSITKVDAEADFMVNSVMWFNEHIPH